MRTTDGMSLTGYADLVRRVVAWVAAQEGYPTYRQIGRRYRLTMDEVADVIADSDAYGPALRVRERTPVRGDTTVEVVR